MVVTKPKLLGELLLERGLITEEQLKQALEEQKRTGERLGQILLEKGFVLPEKVGEVLELQTGYKYFGLRNKEIPIDIINLISEDIARRYRVFPVKKEGNKLYLAMSTPGDLWAVDEIKLITGFEIVPYVSTTSEIDAAINRSYRMESAVRDVVDEIRIAKEEENAEAESEALKEVARLVEEPPTVRLVNQILAGAIHSSVTDIHLDPHDSSLRVRYRVDGMLHDTMEIPKDATPLVISRIKVMADLDISEHRKPQDGRFTAEVEKRSYDMRIAIIPTTEGEKAVIRVLDKAKMLFSLEQLGLFPDEQNIIEKLIKRPYGIILVSGPSGSGKTTTLYAVLQKLNSEEKNIITIEDPVEYKLSGINQIQVNPKGGITFATGLRSILRQDPDIIMVGEIRDEETAKIAIEAGITGHLVLSTVHTNDAPTAITRLMELGVENYLLASSIIGVMSQRLIRIVCSFCAEDDEPSLPLMSELQAFSISDKEITLRRGKGCKHCLNTGFRGRTGAFEVSPMRKDMKELILQGVSTDKIRESAIKSGMRPLYQSGLKKVILGLTTHDEVRRVAYLEEE